LTAIAVTTQWAFKLSQNSSTGQYEYNTQSAMTLVELIKLLLSVGTTLLLLRRGGNSRSDESSWSLAAIRATFRTVPARVYRHYLLLALSYGVYNQLIFAVMESSIDVGTFSLLKSTTPALVSALNWWVLGQPLTMAQTLCMIIQCLGIIPVVVSAPSYSGVDGDGGGGNGGIQLDFHLEDILLMLFCCGMASLNTVFNAIVIQTTDAKISIHVQNIILYVYGVVINLLLYFMVASSSSSAAVASSLSLSSEVEEQENHHISFWYGFGQPRVLFLLLLNSFVGLAITMIYKYGDAVLKTLTQPCASAILVFLSYAALMMGSGGPQQQSSFNVVKAAGAGVVIVDTFLYLNLPPVVTVHHPTDDAKRPTKTVAGTAFSLPQQRPNRNGGLVLAILFFILTGLSYLSSTAARTTLFLMPGTIVTLQQKYETISNSNSTIDLPFNVLDHPNTTHLRPVVDVLEPPEEARPDNNNADDALVNYSQDRLPIVLIIQNLRLDDPSRARSPTHRNHMLAENEAKVNLLELYRSSFVDLYYESPQYVGRNDLEVSCAEPPFARPTIGGPRRCYTCVDQELMHINKTEINQYRDEHRFACAAELFAVIETAMKTTPTVPTNDEEKDQPVHGYMIIHADFFLAPGFLRRAREALIQHPTSTWTAGGVYWGGSVTTREANWAPLHATSARTKGSISSWPWWAVYSDQLNAARARIAQLFPAIVLPNSDTAALIAPMSAYNRSRWVDMYFVPTAIADRFAIFARLMKQFRVINELAVIESLLLAGLDGRVDGEYNFPCYGHCCSTVSAEQLANHTFVERYPCGHKFKLHDPASRSALTAAWAKAAATAADDLPTAAASAAFI
jgi:Nucleotide-sugar transporter